MHMKELTMFTYNLWMGCLHALRYTISIIVSCSYQHCDESQFQTLSCALYTIFSVIKLDLISACTVTKLHSCSGKNTRMPRVHRVLFRIQIFLNIFKTKYTRSTSVSYCSPGSMPQLCSKLY